MANFTSNNDQPAVLATNTANGNGINAITKSGVALHGENSSQGVGFSFGVFGFTPGGIGVGGRTEKNIGVHGVCVNTDPAHPGTGVKGENQNNGTGVDGTSANGAGVTGSTQSGAQSGIFGFNGARGEVPTGLNRPAGNGVWGHTTVEKGSGVVGSVEPGLSQAAGVTGIGPIAGQFFGDVLVTGDVKLVGSDCAEEFDLVESEAVEPGTVMVIDNESALRRGWRAYDRRVAGVVCGAGNYRPGIILDRRDGGSKRIPVALAAK